MAAAEQTSGRGRGENQWWSDEGSLTFTIALAPENHGLLVHQEPRLALMAAVAAIEAIGTLGLPTQGIGIRWPNDIEVGGRKLGGILPERVEIHKGHRLLLGVGLLLFLLNQGKRRKLLRFYAGFLDRGFKRLAGFFFFPQLLRQFRAFG